MAQHAGFSRLVYNYRLELFWQSIDAIKAQSLSVRVAMLRILEKISRS